MPKSRYALLTRAAVSRVSVVDLRAGAILDADTAGASSFSGDVAWAPNRGFAWSHSGAGGGDFQGGSNNCSLYEYSGGNVWTYTLDLVPGGRSWSSMCFHRSGDLFLTRTTGVFIDRYGIDGNFITSYSPSITPGGGDIKEVHVVGDVLYYWAGASGIKRYDINLGQLSDAVTGPFNPVTSIDVDAQGRVLISQHTSGVELYDSAGALITSFNLGAQSHHSAAFDDDGRSVWISYTRYVHNLRISDGVSLGVYDYGSGNDIDSIALLRERRTGRGEWFARGEP
jgi:hypothetical protein